MFKHGTTHSSKKYIYWYYFGSAKGKHRSEFLGMKQGGKGFSLCLTIQERWFAFLRLMVLLSVPPAGHRGQRHPQRASSETEQCFGWAKPGVCYQVQLTGRWTGGEGGFFIVNTLNLWEGAESSQYRDPSMAITYNSRTESSYTEVVHLLILGTSKELFHHALPVGFLEAPYWPLWTQSARLNWPSCEDLLMEGEPVNGFSLGGLNGTSMHVSSLPLNTSQWRQTIRFPVLMSPQEFLRAGNWMLD